MTRPPYNITGPTRNTALRYTFAVAASSLAVAIESAFEKNTEGSVHPFVTAFAAVMASAGLAGPGAGFLSTAILIAWAAFDLHQHDEPWLTTITRCSLFLAEGVVLSAASLYISRATRQASSSEAWHRQLVETAAEGIWVRGNDGAITYANARMAEMLGVSLEALTGRQTEEFFFPADLSVERIRTAALGRGFKEQFDRRLRRNDGSELWVLACCNEIRDEKGEVSGSLAMMTDITERKGAENALRRSEERFRNLFEGVLEGVYQSTPEGRVIVANPMLLKMLGFASEMEMNDGRIAADLYVDAGMRQRLLDRLDSEGGFQNAEYQLRTRDGRIITVVENARVVRDENGQVLYYEGTLTDITERKRIEEQLRQAQKAEALARLSAGVAHDFNNVLSVIKSHAARALNDLGPMHPARFSMEQALQVAESAASLTRQLLSFSRRPVELSAMRSLSLVAGLNTNGNILLVEDEPLVRELSRDMFEREGYKVSVASNAAEAERVGGREIRIDLLITPASMADITGAELARRLRSLHPGMRVLFISGYSDRDAVNRVSNEDALSIPGSDFLEKPFSADSLGRKVRQMFDRPL